MAYNNKKHYNRSQHRDVAHVGGKEKEPTVIPRIQAGSRPEPFYRGDRESALLFQARTGPLPTRKRHWELFDTDPSCRLCGATEETIQHILMDCPRLGARDLPKINLAEYLGLPDDPVDTRVEHTESAKRRLKLWDRLCWQVDKHPDSVQRNEGPTENI
ncbi:hypothetical protein HPB51_023797 [Rhipicephalus microplus]|uniref:Tick transposon n=1 Tax=Rhipicephalus microplus TaxID=6941 RepID=A0A9J6DCY2_RHIMP|nr:hypothetical protein HPB51_023797 [Rhipicephalus microplus]